MGTSTTPPAAGPATRSIAATAPGPPDLAGPVRVDKWDDNDRDLADSLLTRTSSALPPIQIEYLLPDRVVEDLSLRDSPVVTIENAFTPRDPGGCRLPCHCPDLAAVVEAVARRIDRERRHDPSPPDVDAPTNRLPSTPFGHHPGTIIVIAGLVEHPDGPPLRLVETAPLFEHLENELGKVLAAPMFVDGPGAAPGPAIDDGVVRRLAGDPWGLEPRTLHADNALFYLRAMIRLLQTELRPKAGSLTIIDGSTMWIGPGEPGRPGPRPDLPGGNPPGIPPGGHVVGPGRDRHHAGGEHGAHRDDWYLFSMVGRQATPVPSSGRRFDIGGFSLTAPSG